MPDSTSPESPKKLVSKAWIEEFEKTGAGWLQILSGSMAPLIQKWDRIYVEKVDLSKIHRGDIITFWRGGVLITHRVIKKMQHGDELNFIERGDQFFTHSIIPSSSVIGKVKQIKKNEHVYHLNSFIWKLYNKVAGIALLCTYYARHMGRSIPGLPVPVKNLIKKTFVLFKWLMEGFCGILIRAGKKKPS